MVDGAEDEDLAIILLLFYRCGILLLFLTGQIFRILICRRHFASDGLVGVVAALLALGALDPYMHATIRTIIQIAVIYQAILLKLTTITDFIVVLLLVFCNYAPVYITTATLA